MTSYLEDMHVYTHKNKHVPGNNRREPKTGGNKKQKQKKQKKKQKQKQKNSSKKA